MQVVTPNGIVTKPMVPEGETFEFRVWTGNFYVLLPVGVNFAHGKLLPSRRCFGTGGAKPGMHEIGCDLQVEAERKPPDAEMTFLRLYRGEGPRRRRSAAPCAGQKLQGTDLEKQRLYRLGSSWRPHASCLSRFVAQGSHR